jgi:hypothetical protein
MALFQWRDSATKAREPYEYVHILVLFYLKGNFLREWRGEMKVILSAKSSALLGGEEWREIKKGNERDEEKGWVLVLISAMPG